MSATDFDYVVVGSGAGGGPLAANLAEAGFKVLLMEAGGDPCSEDETGRLMYEVPIFHGLSTEYKPCAWDFFVRHYTDDEQQAKDQKKVKVDGKYMVWYPRAGALGGCTAHNAMITVVPQDGDWNYIAQITGDDSWRAERMRPYFARLETCKYVPPPGSLKGMAKNAVTSLIALLRGRKYWRDWTHGHRGRRVQQPATPQALRRRPARRTRAVRHSCSRRPPGRRRESARPLRSGCDRRVCERFCPARRRNVHPA